MGERHAGRGPHPESDRRGGADLAAAPDVRPDHLFALAHAPGDAAGGAEARARHVEDVGHVGRSRGPRGSARRDAGDRRLHEGLEEVRPSRRARAEGDLALRAAGHRQDAAREGGRPRVGRELLLAERLGLRRDVRRPRRRPNPKALRAGTQGCARDRVHRRAGRGRRSALGPRVQPRAGPDAEPAARRAGRLQQPRAGDRHGRLEPPPGPRSRAATPRPLRPAGSRVASRSRRPRGDPEGPHTRQAARLGCRPRRDRAPDRRPHRSGPVQHRERGCDLRRPRRSSRRSITSTSTTPWSASSPASSSGA